MLMEAKEGFKEELDRARQILMKIIRDTSVPRNIRRAATDALSALNEEKRTPGVRASIAISHLNEIINDINMPFSTRSQLLMCIGILEQVKD